MKKITAALMLAFILAGSAPAMAADEHARTVFNRCSDFFSTFDRPFTRPGNKQGFWNATADWIRNIDK